MDKKPDNNKITFKRKIFLSSVIFFIAANFSLAQTNDTCIYREFYYSHYDNWDNIKVVSDSINFSNYIIFKVILDKKNSYINVEIFFEDNLKNLFNSNRQYNYEVFSWPLYANSWGRKGIDSITYFKIINQGQNNINKMEARYFDRLDMVENNASIFKDLNTWSISNSNNNEEYYIFKTSFDGIVIENDLKRTYHSEFTYKNQKVLIPFIRYIPLFEVTKSELIKAGLIKMEPISICLQN